MKVNVRMLIAHDCHLSKYDTLTYGMDTVGQDSYHFVRRMAMYCTPLPGENNKNGLIDINMHVVL